MPSAFIIAPIIAASLVLSVSVPLFSYACGLAVFGFAHVVRELQFVDQRFGARIQRNFACGLFILLTGVVIARSINVFIPSYANVAYNCELFLVFLLVLLVPFTMAKKSDYRKFHSLGIAIAIGCGFLVSPITTILILAVLHNLTPIGFMTEIVPKERKLAVVVISAIVFLLIPAMIAVGIFEQIFSPLFSVRENYNIFPTGPLRQHLGVFLPAVIRNADFATNAFSAVVFTQCMHYLAVIYVMPALQNALTQPKDIKTYLPWPRARVTAVVIISVTIIMLISYWQDFRWTRSIYGIAAALHAYVEIPILLWAFSTIEQTATTTDQKVSMPNWLKMTTKHKISS